jgi:hypothetical protein
MYEKDTANMNDSQVLAKEMQGQNEPYWNKRGHQRPIAVRVA